MTPGSRRQADRTATAEIVVVGAGMVGPVAAMYLARRFGRVDVLEQRDDPRASSADAVGARSLTVILSARGWRVLDELGVAEAVRAACVPLRGRQAHLPDGREHFTPYSRNGDRIWAVERASLHRVLLDAAQASPGVRLCFGEAVEVVEPDGPALVVRGPSGTHRVDCRLVIGCDGVHSPVRSALVTKGAGLRFHRLALGYQEIAISGGAAGGTTLARDAFHYWPRPPGLFGAFPTADGGFTGSLFLPLDGRPGSAYTAGAGAPALAARLFPDLAAAVPDLADQVAQRPVNALPTVRCDRWVWQGKLASVGDACHAMAPFMGQGMNCAFEDARLLDQCLGQAEDWSTGLADYQELRRQDADAIVAISQEHYDTLVHPPVGADAVEPALCQRLVDLFPERFASLYERCAFSEDRYASLKQADEAMRGLAEELLRVYGPDLLSAPDERMRRLVRRQATAAAPV